VTLPVVAEVAAAEMTMLDVIGNDDNDVVVITAKKAVVVIATVSTRTATIWLFLVFLLKYFISLPLSIQ
jgi:hypothetical protein